MTLMHKISSPNMVGIGKSLVVRFDSEDITSVWYTYNNSSNLLLSNVFIINEASEGNELKFENYAPSLVLPAKSSAERLNISSADQSFFFSSNSGRGLEEESSKIMSIVNICSFN